MNLLGWLPMTVRFTKAWQVALLCAAGWLTQTLARSRVHYFITSNLRLKVEAKFRLEGRPLWGYSYISNKNEGMGSSYELALLSPLNKGRGRRNGGKGRLCTQR